MTRQQYEAALNAARQNYQGVATQEAGQLGTRAQLAMAEKVLADTQIHAPFAGYVGARAVTPGEYVSTSSKIATYDDILHNAEAAIAYGKAAALDPKNPEYRSAQGEATVLAAQGQVTHEAQDAFKKALEADPGARMDMGQSIFLCVLATRTFEARL